MIIGGLLSKHTDGREKYQCVYNEFFTDEFCRNVRCVLEIGVKNGDGLEAWRRVFPHSNVLVYGIDIDPCSHIWSFLADSTCKSCTDRFFMHRGQADVIIDDGSHKPEDQLKTLANFWSHLKRGGIYVLEDVGAREPFDPFVDDVRRIAAGGNVHTRPVNANDGVIVITNGSNDRTQPPCEQ